MEFRSRRSMGTVKTDMIPQRQSSSASRPSSASRKSRIPGSVTRKRSSSSNRPTRYVGGATMKTPRSLSAPRTPRNLSAPRTPNRNVLAPLSMNLTRGTARSSSIISKEKDTRPINDKEWQIRTRDEIITFCKALNCQLVKKDFPLDTSRFKVVFELLYGCLHPVFVLPASKMWKQFIPEMMKQLGYPGNVPGSTFQTLGSLHSWPVVLAMLHFLLTLARNSVSLGELTDADYFDGVDDFDCDDEGAEDAALTCSMELATFRYFRSAYLKYMSGDDDYAEDLDGLYNELLSINNVDSSDLQRMAKEVDRLKAEYAGLKSQSGNVERLRQKAHDTVRDVKQMETFIQKLRNNLDFKHKELDNIRGRTAVLEAVATDFARSINDCEAVCKQKGLDWNQSANIDYVLTELSSRLDVRRSTVKEADARKCKMEMTLGKRLDKVDTLRRTFNRNLIGLDDSLMLDPSGCNVEAVADKLSDLLATEKVNEDKKVKDAADLKTRITTVRNATFKAVKELEALTKVYADANKEQADTIEAIRKEDETLTKEIKRVKDQYLALMQQTQVKERDLVVKKNDLEAAEKQLAEAKHHFVAVEKEGAELLKSTGDEILKRRSEELASRDLAKCQLEAMIRSVTQKYEEATEIVKKTMDDVEAIKKTMDDI